MARRENLVNPASKAFTLIELLVVISIMTMMMSIILPVTSRAKEQGYRIQCMSRMRQLTFAWKIYAEYNDDRLCSPDTFWNDGVGHNWVADGPTSPGNSIGGTEQAIKDGVLWDYTMKTLELYECSSARGNLSVNSRPERLRDYSISNTMGGYNRDGVRTFRTSAEIPRPAEKMVFTDTDGGFYSQIGGIETHWTSGSFWPLERNLSGTQWHFERSSNGVPYNIITLRHSDGCNLTFADCHCEHWRWRDRRTVKLANDEISEQQASDNNADLNRMIRLLKGH